VLSVFDAAFHARSNIVFELNGFIVNVSSHVGVHITVIFTLIIFSHQTNADPQLFVKFNIRAVIAFHQFLANVSLKSDILKAHVHFSQFSAASS